MSYRPLPLDRAAYSLAGGLDTKVHGLVLPPPKLQECTNAFVDQTGSVRRRYGQSVLASTDVAGNTISGSWQAAATHQGRLLGVSAGQRLYDYGETDARWADRGTHYSWPIATTPVDALVMSATQPATHDMGIIGNYTLYAYDYIIPNGANADYYTAFTLVDTNGTRYATNQSLSSKINSAALLSSSVKVVTSGTKFYIIYSDVNAVANIKCFIIDTTSAATIASSLVGAATTLIGTFGGALDAYVSAGGSVFVAWIHSTVNTVGLMNVNTSGAAVGAISWVAPGPSQPLSISVSALTNIGVAFVCGTALADVYARTYTFNGTAFTLTQTSAALDVVAGTLVQCVWTNVTTLRIFYHATFTSYTGLKQVTFTTAGAAGVPTAYLARSIMVSRPWMADAGDVGPFVWVINEDGVTSTAQPTLYLMRYDGLFMGVASRGIAAVTLVSLAFGLPHVPSRSHVYHTISDQYARIAGNGDPAFSPGTGTSSMMRDIAVDMSNTTSGAFAEEGNCTYFAGGVLQQYDAVGTTEVSFANFVDTQHRVTMTQATIAGTHLTLLKEYSYRFTYMWVNAQGQRELGTDGGSKNITLTGGNNQVTITLDALPWTRKSSLTGRQNLVIAVWRCVDPTGNDQFNLVGTVSNAILTDKLTFVDSMTDAVAATQELLYMGSSQPGDELDNVGPPACSLIAAGNNRVFLAGLADDPNLIWYSKARGHGEALAFNDALTIVIPQADGPITALAVFAEYLIVFCERGIYRVNGGGLSNTGTSGGFTEPVRVMTDGGVANWRSVVVTPMGVMYRGVKGIMLLTPGFTTEYIGAPVEGLLLSSATLSSAILLPRAQQVRFTTDVCTLVYDYYHNQWYKFTHTMSPGFAVLWNDVFAGPSSSMVYEDPAVWSDGGQNYQVTLVLGWMHGSALPSDIAIRKVGLVGQSLDQHYLTIQIAKDQASTANQTVDVTIAGAGPIQKQTRVKDQVVSQMEITVGDWNTAIYGFPFSLSTAGFCLNEITFELALRNKVMGRKE